MAKRGRKRKDGNYKSVKTINYLTDFDSRCLIEQRRNSLDVKLKFSKVWVSIRHCGQCLGGILKFSLKSLALDLITGKNYKSMNLVVPTVT